MSAGLYDPTTAAFQEDLHAVYRRLRDEHPVYVDHEGVVVLSRFDDVWNAVHNWPVFSSDHVAEAAMQLPTMIYMDAPRHADLRSLVSRAFTPRRVAGLEARIRRIANDLLDRCGSDFDLAHDYAAPLPSTMMAELIGVPDDQREHFRVLTEAFLEIPGPRLRQRAVSPPSTTCSAPSWSSDGRIRRTT